MCRAEILTHPRCRLLALVVALGVAQGGDGFERELGVDHQGPVVRQEYRAVRPAPVGERELEFVAVFRQPVLDDELHAALAERAALLLVGQHALQRGHLRRQVGDVPLRAVDDREPLVELLQAFDRVLARRGHRLVEVMRDRIEAVVDRALEFGLAAGQHVAHGIDAHRGFRLQPRQLGHLLVRGLPVAPAQCPHHDQDDRNQDCKPREQGADRGGNGEDIVGHRGHSTSIRSIGTKSEQ